MSTTKDKCLESIFASNRPPSPQESSVAGESLQLCDQKLEVVDTRIADLEHELEELKAQRATIKKERHRYVDILSARRLIPPEIIGRFMELACVDTKPESSQSSGTYQQVLSFMLVSREWYRTACGVAHFWTELDMDLTEYSAEETEQIIIKANNRFARAAELPLSLHLAFSAAVPTNTLITGFIHSLTPRLGVFSFRIQVDSISELQILTSVLHHPASSSTLVWPRLHTLRIDIHSEHEITADYELSNPLTNFPLLSKAAISSPHIIFALRQMPWSNLSSLDLGPLRQLETRQYLSILEECINLRSLRLCMKRQIGTDQLNNSVPVTALPHLTHLHVENTDTQESRMGRLLSRLKLPSLRSCILTTLNDGGYYTSIIAKLAELFQRSECSESMEYLELNLARGLAHRPDTLGHLFRQVPRLTALKLSGYKMDIDALRGVPLSIRNLSVKLSYYRIDDARTAFVEYLNSRFADSDEPMKAQLSVVDTVTTVLIRQNLDTLRNNVGSSLDVAMD
ncbi:hypothetical protein EST38_g12558 [Candolleomyces aberdarensis]|uniref:F-box domain-containing protein n=1 Tax=Candolleomyces aberdarensis TaxID=2316362 RepID=A0A4Q2D558_9AGAR|nr:hypothetical protein EST38_g12558 [Candolleomyces aberdarensis]